jgi:sporulation protein YtfJ
MENKQHPIGELMSTTMQRIREMVDVNTIIGQPIQAGEVTLIPVSRVSFGFATGGSDWVGKNQKAEAANAFGGGAGSGVSIVPVAFLVVKGDLVRMIPVSSYPATSVERIIEMVPEVVDKVTSFIEKQKEKDKEDF